MTMATERRNKRARYTVAAVAAAAAACLLLLSIPRKYEMTDEGQ